jgi:hypothetical protein
LIALYFVVIKKDFDGALFVLDPWGLNQKNAA